MQRQYVMAILLAIPSFLSGALPTNRDHNISKTIVLRDKEGKEAPFDKNFLKKEFVYFRTLFENARPTNESFLVDVGTIDDLIHLCKLLKKFPDAKDVKVLKNALNELPVREIGKLDIMANNLEHPRILRATAWLLAKRYATRRLEKEEIVRHIHPDRVRQINKALFILYEMYWEPKPRLSLQDYQEYGKLLDDLEKAWEYFKDRKICFLRGLCLDKRVSSGALVLSDNFVPYILKDDFINVPHISCLILNNCFIESIPRTFSSNELQNLRCIFLNKNNLKKFPYGLASLPQLTRLDLRDNDIDEFSRFRAGDFPSLETLSLDKNHKCKIISKQIQHLTNLKCIDLEIDVIEVVSEECKKKKIPINIGENTKIPESLSVYRKKNALNVFEHLCFDIKQCYLC